MGTPKLKSLNNNIHFFTTLDCSKKIRIEYILPFKTTHSFFEQFDADEQKIDYFSKMISRAHDHITIFQGNTWYMTAAVGLDNIQVTFLKSNNQALETRHGFEKQLEIYCQKQNIEV